jgi:hypothetical protein
MSLLPKIIYDAGAGDITLAFLQPNKNVSADNLEAVRHDNIASSGVKEVVYERTDEFLEFDMPWMSIGADVAAWRAFMDFALAGGEFDYYPDSDLADHSAYTLEDTNYKSAYKVPAQYSFSAKFRKKVPWP